VFLAVGLVDGERVARLLKLNKVISEVETGSGIAGPTRMTALNGGLTGVVTRWAVIEIPPALRPQLYCVRNTNEQLMAREGIRREKIHRVTLFGSPPNLEM